MAPAGEFYWAGARSVSEEFLEIDLSRALGLDNDLLDQGIDDDERDHWLRVFAVMFGREAFLKGGAEQSAHIPRSRAIAEAHSTKNASPTICRTSFSNGVSEPRHRLFRRPRRPRPTRSARSGARPALPAPIHPLREDRDLSPVRDRRYDEYGLETGSAATSGAGDADGHTFSDTAARYWSGSSRPLITRVSSIWATVRRDYRPTTAVCSPAERRSLVPSAFPMRSWRGP